MRVFRCGKKGVRSFYERTTGRFTLVVPDYEYEGSIYETLWESARLSGDCNKAQKPCAHVIPEVWDTSLDARVVAGES